ncbi:PDZ domain-containing protein, partial [bacterium]|nr:PDZ domain-containing protein [bacterium]
MGNRLAYRSNEAILLLLKKTAVMIVVVFYSGISLSAEESIIDSEIRNLENFSNVYHLIQQRYVERQTPDSLIKFAIQGMVKSLDSYSTILNSKELENLELQSVGKYTGIGVSIQEREKLFIVTQVFDNSPAYDAGLKPGNVIVRVNDNVLGDKSIEDLNQLVMGEIGTSIDIGFYHVDRPDHIIRKTITRALVNVNSVETFEHEPSIGVIRIHQFLKHTPREISEYLTEKSFKTIILDLRNNPGGLLVSAVETAEIFVEMGAIVETRDRDEKV